MHSQICRRCPQKSESVWSCRSKSQDHIELLDVYKQTFFYMKFDVKIHLSLFRTPLLPLGSTCEPEIQFLFYIKRTALPFVNCYSEQLICDRVPFMGSACSQSREFRDCTPSNRSWISPAIHHIHCDVLYTGSVRCPSLIVCEDSFDDVHSMSKSKH